MNEKRNSGEKFYLSTPRIEFPKEKLKIKFLKPLLIVLLAGFVVYEVVFSSFFRIKAINFEGIETQQIRQAAEEDLIGKNILFILPGNYLQKLSKNFPALQEASLIRGLPNTILLKAKERSQSLIWCSKNSCFEVDNDGIAFKKIGKPDENKVVVIHDLKGETVNLADKILPKSFVAFFLDAVDQIPKKFQINFKKAEVEETTFKLTFYYDDNRQLIFDTSQSLDNQIFALQQTLDQKKDDIKQYIDLRVPGLVYYK
ncbi:hypothetical protein COT77_02415 [Candidatus Berkelbacteria bacterium CG10_big_fil_rev_8_21_14_0_10_41_12]|uniref:Uncharacterized protein n=1 Tax=Candidatus Berkelbacteria bacterium CG10_big_fil_rev_8_21_14_0_10_41_12 TaxID=1974513 RepID=A0A2M6WWU8_9BACT|nr:MAG: hypothetical protein COT77_02415 [Candidatus Berkelbacteria bacterium CG10_big_fil_rev_8_21_14_0_10_41_12]